MHHIGHFAVFELCILVLTAMVYAVLSKLTTRPDDDDADPTALREYLQRETTEGGGPKHASPCR